jgi:hypothetical protein
LSLLKFDLIEELELELKKLRKIKCMQFVLINLSSLSLFFIR